MIFIMKNRHKSFLKLLFFCSTWSMVFMINLFLPSLAFGQHGEKATLTSIPIDYSDDSTWLCLPGRFNDACSTDLTTTVIDTKGKFSIESWESNPTAPIDCFYVYPTVSTDPGKNSSMVPGEAEEKIIEQQFARFSSHCRSFAPMYRQFTLGAFVSGEADPLGLGYNDIKDAWNYYLEHYNNGRGFILIGHSQGAAVLKEIIRKEIEGKTTESKMVGAFLLGTTVSVLKGSDTGGDFNHIPVCQSPSQIGCIISFNTFLSTSPPSSNPMFGSIDEPGFEAVCTNPASLDRSNGKLRPYLTSDKRLVFGSIEIEVPQTSIPWVSTENAILTPWVSVPDMVYAKCTSNEYATFLEVNLPENPNDVRSNEITGVVPDCPQCGLHLVEVDLTMGNLLNIIELQSHTWLNSQN
jgi:hypothetical protein